MSLSMDVAGNAYLNRPGLYVWIPGKKFPNWDGPEIVDTRAAFERTGLKVTFGLITQPGLENKPYRTIVAPTGAALGTVKRVMDSLAASGFLMSTSRNRALHVTTGLLNDWTQAYINRLLPKLELGIFETGLAITSAAIIDYEGLACWGGEVAAAQLTGHLKPKIQTLYINESRQIQFMKQFKVRRASPLNLGTVGGSMQLRRQFWSPALNRDQSLMQAHPLVVNADLLASNNARNTETAEVIYEKYLKALCR